MLFTDKDTSLSRILMVKDNIINVSSSPKEVVVLISAPVVLKSVMTNGMDLSETEVEAKMLHLIRRDFRII